MARQHRAFLLRCWTQYGSVERIEIERISTGEKTITRSVSEAVEWVCARSGETDGPSLLGDVKGIGSALRK